MKHLLFRNIFLLISLFVAAATSIAQDEYAFKEVIAPSEVYSVGVGAPLIATKPCTHAEMLYKVEYMNIFGGDMVTQLTFKGYNPGEALTRHFVVWMANTIKRNIRDVPSEPLTKVFEGDCTIASGGGENNRIPLLTIVLEQPFEYGGNAKSIRVVIESTGEAVTHEVCFEQYRFKTESCYATADEAGGEWSQSERSLFPITTITVGTPVVNLTGTVVNQDSVPIPGASIQMKSMESVIYSGETDSNGNYSIRIEEGNQYYMATVSKSGCATYTERCFGINARKHPKRDFMLYDAVEYKAGRRATIIMPETPDSSMGKFYRLDRTTRQLIFERELSPQANVPYVIFPNKDFTIDLKPLNLNLEAGKTEIPGVAFIGSYINYDYSKYDGQQVVYLDETSDCGPYYIVEEGRYPMLLYRVAALRAFIINELLWDAKDVVFHDDSDGISTSDNDIVENAVAYDLQGRRLNGIPQKGVYIQNGKKRVR